VLVHVRQAGKIRRLGERAVLDVDFYGCEWNAVILDDDYFQAVWKNLSLNDFLELCTLRSEHSGNDETRHRKNNQSSAPGTGSFLL